jgi:hypothetical protein
MNTTTKDMDEGSNFIIDLQNKMIKFYWGEVDRLRNLYAEEKVKNQDMCLNCPHWLLANQREIHRAVGYLLAGESLSEFSPAIIRAAIEEEKKLDL